MSKKRKLENDGKISDPLQLVEWLPDELRQQIANLVTSYLDTLPSHTLKQLHNKCSKIRFINKTWTGVHTFGFWFGNKVCAVVGQPKDTFNLLDCATENDFTIHCRELFIKTNYDLNNILCFDHGMTDENILIKTSTCNQNGYSMMCIKDELCTVKRHLIYRIDRRI